MESVTTTSLDSASYNSLYSQLSKANALLIPDRSLSTFGRRTLKSMRAQESGWPLAGVFTFVDVARRYLKKQNQFRPQTDALEAFAHLVQKRSDVPIAKLKDEFDLAAKLRKIAPLAMLAKIVSSEDYRDELSPTLFGAIYSALLLEDFAQSRHEESHEFAYIERCLEYLRDHPDTEFDFHLFRPTLAPSRNLFIVGFRDLYPLEGELASELAKKFSVVRQFGDMATTGGADIVAIKQKFASAAITPSSQLLWISHVARPGPLEAQHLTSAERPLRLALDKRLRYFSPAEIRVREKWESEPELLRTLLDSLASPSVKALVDTIISLRDPALLDVLKNLQFFSTEQVDRKIGTEGTRKSTLVVEVEDIPLLDPSRTLIWGNQKTWEEFFLSVPSLGTHLKTSDELERILLVEGLVFPDLKEEQRRLKQILAYWAPQLRTLEVKTSAEFKSDGELYAPKAVAQKLLSPSGLECLARCPMQFYFDRELRLPSVEIPDDLDGSPLRRGTWIHGVLEKINWSEVSRISQKEIERVMRSELEKAFKNFASPAYLKVLQSQVPSLSEALLFYIEKLEAPLAQLFPFRKFEREKDIKCDWSSVMGLRGRVDRLDFVGEGAFLWDYKTANFSGTRFSTLLENGKFQWLLYREIFERDGIPIYGGGYLNPLDLKKSRLIFFESAPLPGSFFDFLSEHGVRVETLKRDEETRLMDRLREIITALGEKWSAPTRPSEPLNEKVCGDCNYVGYCGRPYGVWPC